MQTQLTLKKAIAIVTCLTIGIYSGYSQTYWKIKGNSGINDTVDFIGVKNQAALKFKTWNRERMIISSNGNVGIGTSSPVNLLDVNASSSAVVAIKSDSSNANLFLDKGLASSNSLMAFKTLGVTKWQAGMIGGENFTIKGMDTGYASVSLIATALNIKSSGNVSLYIDKKNSTDNSFITYRTNGDGKWQTGTANGEDFIIKSLDPGASNKFTVMASQMTFKSEGGIDFYAKVTTKPRMRLSSSGKLGLGLDSASTQPNCLLTLGYNSACKPGSSKWQVSSDRRLKSNVEGFTDGLNVLDKINPVWFNYNGKAGLPTDERFAGTIAQELQEVAPYMVKDWTYTTSSGTEEKYLSVDYSALDFVVVNSIKELKKNNDGLRAENTELKSKLDALESRLTQFENALSQCCSNFQPAKEIAPKQNAELEQNQPNPFNQSSVIKCYIPSMKSSAKIVITDVTGKTVKTYNVATSGYNEVIINANDLSAGSYTYTLMIDNEKINSKQMVLTSK